jgi:hypothetical protein
LNNVNGVFSPVFTDQGFGKIGGYKLTSTADIALAYDYASEDKDNYLILYRPGTGCIYILQNTNTLPQ